MAFRSVTGGGLARRDGYRGGIWPRGGGAMGGRGFGMGGRVHRGAIGHPMAARLGMQREGRDAAGFDDSAGQTGMEDRRVAARGYPDRGLGLMERRGYREERVDRESKGFGAMGRERVFGRSGFDRSGADQGEGRGAAAQAMAEGRVAGRTRVLDREEMREGSRGCLCFLVALMRTWVLESHLWGVENAEKRG